MLAKAAEQQRETVQIRRKTKAGHSSWPWRDHLADRVGRNCLAAYGRGEPMGALSMPPTTDA